MEHNVLEDVQAEREHLLAKRKTLLAAFTKATHSGKRTRAAELYIRIRQTNKFLEALDEIERARKPLQATRYVVSSLFLHESFKKLTADQNEEFFFVTGNEVGGALVLDQWAEFSHQRRTFAGVTGDTRSTHKLLIKLEQFGHRLLGTFHSHPGNGADATHPSGIDERFQERLENAGHLAVMAIFSRDGFVRFMRLDREVDIEIYGKGVERHAPGIYRLENIDQD